jgi:competence protein ComEA
VIFPAFVGDEEFSDDEDLSEEGAAEAPTPAGAVPVELAASWVDRLKPNLVSRPGAAIRRFDPVLAWQLSGPAARGLFVVLLLAVLGGAWLAWRAVPRAPATVVVVPLVASATPTAAPAPTLVVQVVGPVVRPGIVRLPEGSRVVDAIRAAGGLRSGSSAGAVNLARKLLDGEQLVVGPGAPAGGIAAGGAGSASGAGVASGPIDLNTAGLAELDTLPHVGPVLAQRIIDWRDSHGHFASVDELREIAGIGSRIFTALSPLVRV